MTNGSDKHHDRNGRKKANGKKAKPKDPRAALKRKNLLPAGLAADRK